MWKRRGFRPSLDSLEERLTLSSGVADVDRTENHQGQFGDQTDVDIPGSDGEREDDGATTGKGGQSATALGAAAANANAATMFLLAGTARGSYTSRQKNPDMATAFTGSANGKVTPLGQVSIAGMFQTPGLVTNGKIHGSLTLRGQHGSLTLSLTGPATGQSSSKAFRLTYMITGGTGPFRNAHGTGAVAITVTPAATTGTGFPRLGHGKVSLVFG